MLKVRQNGNQPKRKSSMNMKESRVIATFTEQEANTSSYIINWPTLRRKSSSSKESIEISVTTERSAKDKEQYL